MPEGIADSSARWEMYWHYVRVLGGKARVTWNTTPEYAAMADLHRFHKHMNPRLPLLDLGCGNGWQTRFLAKHFQRVVGVDISPTALELARKETVGETNVEYRVLDVTNTAECEALHETLGDVNIYMRGVLHLVQKSERSNFIAGLSALLGETGTLYQLELTTEAVAMMRDVRATYLFTSPSGFDNALDLETSFPEDRWIVIDRGQDVTIGTVDLVSGEERPIPANYIIARRRQSWDAGRHGSHDN